MESNYLEAQQQIEALKKDVAAMAKLRAINVTDMINAYVEKYGKEAMDVTAGVWAKGILRNAQRLAEKGKVERNAIGAASVLTGLHTRGGVTGEVVLATPQKAIRQERDCPFSDQWTPEMCERISGASMKAICQALHPKLITYHNKYLSRGDDCCEIVFELRE